MAREMKDSGIPWIGEIPEEWEIIRVKQHYPFSTGFTPESKNEAYYDESGIEWVTIADLEDHSVKHSNKGISKLYIEKFKPSIIPSGSLLYSFKLSVGQVSITDRELFTNEAIAAFSNLSDTETRFLYYSSQVCIIHNANENIYGARLLNQDLIKNAIIIFPPLSEQKSIADFLDRKCEEIDEMVALQEKIIEELKAYKQSIITEAVTKGLDPNAPLKDSGIEWIGEIPEGWRIPSLGYITTKIGSGSTPNGGANVYVSSGIKFMRSQNVLNDGFSLDDVAYISEEIDEEMKGTRVAVNDILFNITGGSIGRCYVVEESLGRANVNQHVCIVRSESVSSRFLMYYLQSYLGQEQVRTLQTGGNREGLSAKAFKRMVILLPESEEQIYIADYLDAKCSEIDALIQLKLQKIDSLKEYKKSVIYEYVTGKKEVATHKKVVFL